MSDFFRVIQVKANLTERSADFDQLFNFIFNFIFIICVSDCVALFPSTQSALCRTWADWKQPCAGNKWDSEKKQVGKIIKRLWRTPASSLVPVLLVSQSFILPPCPVNCTASCLLIFPRAVPCAVLCLLLVWIASYTNLDLRFPLLSHVILSSIDWALMRKPLLFIAMYCHLKGPVTEDVYRTLLMELLHCLSIKQERIKRSSHCEYVCAPDDFCGSVFATKLEETWHESLLCISLISHEKWEM